MKEASPKELSAEGAKMMHEVLLKAVEEADKYKDLKTADLLSMLTASVANNTDFYGHQEILERIGAGRLTDNQVEAARRAGYQKAFPAMMAPWSEGKLFGCQGLDFLSCMLLTEEEVEIDMQTWLRVDAAAQAVGVDGEWAHIQDFATTRIIIPAKHRRAFFDGGSLKPASSLPRSHRMAWNRWRADFIAANKRWGW